MMANFNTIKKTLTRAIVLFQTSLTFLVLFVFYMLLYLFGFRIAIEELVGVAFFHVINAVIFALISIFIFALLGLPIRLNKKWNAWWRGKFLIAPVMSFFGLLFTSLSFSFAQQVEYKLDGLFHQTIQPNVFLAIPAWFFLGFGLLHIYPPYMLQMRLVDWLQKKDFV